MHYIYYILYTLCGLFIKLWMKLLGLPVLWNTNTAPITTLASETAGPTFLLWGTGIKLCPHFHPPVGGARGCWKTEGESMKKDILPVYSLLLGAAMMQWPFR